MTTTNIEFTSHIPVQLIDCNFSDERVCVAARTSTAGAEASDGAKQGLINSLMKNRHGSPFEHMAATYLRNSDRKEDIVYFGPMGCRTGCYLVMFGDLDPEDIFDLVTDMCGFILSYEGDIPGAEPEQCGNYSEQNLNMARYYIRKYRDELVEHKRFTYPD